MTLPIGKATPLLLGDVTLRIKAEERAEALLIENQRLSAALTATRRENERLKTRVTLDIRGSAS